MKISCAIYVLGVFFLFIAPSSMFSQGSTFEKCFPFKALSPHPAFLSGFSDKSLNPDGTLEKQS